ncbi:MAG: GAF domain-containing protein [Myxococcota bacterium]
MSEDIVQSEIAPVDEGPVARPTGDVQSAIVSWLSRSGGEIQEDIRDLDGEQLATLLQQVGGLVRQQEAKVASMQEIGSALGQTIQLDELLALIMERITKLMDAERSTLFLVDEENDELWSKVSQGVRNKEIRLKRGQGIAGWVAMTGKSINVRDAYGDPRFNPAVDEETGFKTRNILCQPVRNQEGKIIGVVQVLNRHTGEFTAQDENLLSAIASQTAVAIENSKLYLSVMQKNFELGQTKDKLERKVAELDLLYDIEREVNLAMDFEELVRSITEKTLEHISAHASALTLREDDRLRMYVLADRVEGVDAREWDFFVRTLPGNRGIASHVMDSGEPFICNVGTCGEDIAEAASEEIGMTVRNVICVPLFDEGEIIGALEVINGDGGDDDDQVGFSQDDRKILTLIAGQIASTVAARRHRREQQKAERLATIGQMLSGVLHDLKNPIAVVSGNVQLMVRADERSKREEYATTIKRQFEHLNQMTRELLVFARGESDITLERVELDHFIGEVFELLEPELDDRDVVLDVNLEYDGPLEIDPGKMKRTILNLARNAADAMEDGGVFGIHVYEEDGEIVMAFSDTGGGIPVEVRATLFDTFVTEGKPHGTGLGLAIVKKIVEEHRARIDFDTTLGEGTTFYIRFPKSSGEVND